MQKNGRILHPPIERKSGLKDPHSHFARATITPCIIRDCGNVHLFYIKDPKVDITIIKRYYYDTLHRWYAWDIHPALQLIYADFVTLVGREAVKEVQKLVDVGADGMWGEGTAEAVKKFNADFEAKRTQNPDYAWRVFLQFDAQKREVFQSLAKNNPEAYADHLQKWLKRSDALKIYMQPVLTGKK